MFRFYFDWKKLNISTNIGHKVDALEKIMGVLKGKTIIVTGASRGIGQAIALKFATFGANLVILSNDSQENIQKTVDQIISSGGQALALNIDISDFNALEGAVTNAIERFGGIDVLVNNTSATCFDNTLHLSAKQFDLMMATSVRAAFFLSQICILHLKKASNPHIVNISPPLNLDSQWFNVHLGFSISKYAMSMVTLGMAVEFKQEKIAVNSLWPKSTIATQTIKDHFSPKVYAGSRKPSIMADAAYELISRESTKYTGHFYTDEAILQESGVANFSHYAVDPDTPLMQALFIPPEEHMTPVSQNLFTKKRLN